VKIDIDAQRSMITGGFPFFVATDLDVVDLLHPSHRQEAIVYVGRRCDIPSMKVGGTGLFALCLGEEMMICTEESKAVHRFDKR
jgi:hypothetical protein